MCPLNCGVRASHQPVSRRAIPMAKLRIFFWNMLKTNENAPFLFEILKVLGESKVDFVCLQEAGQNIIQALASVRDSQRLTFKTPVPVHAGGEEEEEEEKETEGDRPGPSVPGPSVPGPSVPVLQRSPTAIQNWPLPDPQKVAGRNPHKIVKRDSSFIGETSESEVYYS